MDAEAGREPEPASLNNELVWWVERVLRGASETHRDDPRRSHDVTTLVLRGRYRSPTRSTHSTRYQEGLLVDLDWLLCPTMTMEQFARVGDADDPSFTIVYPYNQWPPILTPAPGGATYHTRSVYGLRPMDNYSPALGFDFEDIPTRNVDDSPRQTLLADAVSSPEFVDRSHDTGVNASRSDGSGRWVRRGVFDTPLSMLPGSFAPAANDHMLNNAGTAGVFTRLDAAP